MIKNKPKAIFCWSGGKDSAYCLHKVLSENLFKVEYLLTTVNENYHRVSMHGIKEELLDIQAEAIGIPLLKVKVKEGTNEEYENLMERILLKVKSEGINHVIFGDIFLDDLRNYREKNLSKVGMKAVFPIWKTDTEVIVRNFIKQNFKTVICCTNDGYLGKEWLGREIDQSFIEQLPGNVDPAGENGEYHTFCYNGPLFKKKVDFKIGENIYKTIEINSSNNNSTKGFWYCDLIPMDGG